MTRFFRLLSLALALAAAPLAVGGALALDKLSVGGAWIPAAVPEHGITDIYLSIVTGHQPDSLIGVSSPWAQRVEMRRYSQMNTMLIKGRKEDGVSEINIPADTRADLVPDELHLKLFYATRDLKPGDYVPLVLKFKNAGEIQIQAHVVKWGKQS